MKYLIGCDFGGGASKATLLREDGCVIAEASSEYETKYPHPGWAEQDPEDSLKAFLANIRSLLEQTGIDASQVAALALDGATHTAVLLDEKDEVIRPAIYWTDQRAVKEAREDMALPRRRGICAARSFPWTRSLPKIPSGNRKSRHRDMAQTGCLLDRK